MLWSSMFNNVYKYFVSIKITKQDFKCNFRHHEASDIAFLSDLRTPSVRSVAKPPLRKERPAVTVKMSPTVR